MRVLITGGAGYIGSVLGEQLVASGYEVTVYDNLCKGFADAIAPGARFVHGDIHDRPHLTETLRNHRIEAVVHMAGLIAVGESVQKPALYYHANVTGGLSLLSAMTDARVSALLFSSTAACYGEPVSTPIVETDPTEPTNPYGETKLCFERALRWHAEAYGLKHTCLRYFNAAGASATRGERHEPETHLIPLVLRAALGLSPAVTVFGDDYPTKDGTCVRDYIHVLDLAHAHRLALDALAGRNEMRKVYNLGCGGGFTVKEVIDVAAKVTGKTIPFKMGPRRPGDSAVLVASSARIKAELGWQPRYESLEPIIASAYRLMKA